MARLTKVTYHFLTTGDGIDNDSRIKIEIYQNVGGQRQLIARQNFTGGGGEIYTDCIIVSSIDRIQLNGKHSYIEIQPNGNDKWQSECDIQFTFDDGVVRSFNHGSIKLGNHDGWGHFVDSVLAGIDI